MEILISLLIVVAIVAVIIWLLNLIPWPEGFGMVKLIIILIVVIAALLRVLPLLFG